MNLLKSIFISCFVSWLALVSIYSIIQLSKATDPLLSWFGLALAAGAPLVFFIKAFMFKSARTPRHPVGFSIVGGMGLAICLALSWRFGQAAGIIHVWAGITLLGWLLYIRWYSNFKGRDAKDLRVGATLPEFQLQTMEGQSVSSQNFKTRPHLLLFYRGNWCPFCTAQIEELAAAYQRLEDSGVTAVLISPQSAAKSQKLAARFNIPMVFLRDGNNAASKQLGILHEWGTPMGMQLLGYESETVLPTVILTDTQGNIVYSDQTDNYRVRPEARAFEALVEKAGMTKKA